MNLNHILGSSYYLKEEFNSLNSLLSGEVWFFDSSNQEESSGVIVRFLRVAYHKNKKIKLSDERLGRLLTDEEIYSLINKEIENIENFFLFKIYKIQILKNNISAKPPKSLEENIEIIRDYLPQNYSAKRSLRDLVTYWAYYKETRFLESPPTKEAWIESRRI